MQPRSESETHPTPNEGDEFVHPIDSLLSYSSSTRPSASLLLSDTLHHENATPPNGNNSSRTIRQTINTSEGISLIPMGNTPFLPHMSNATSTSLGHQKYHGNNITAVAHPDAPLPPVHASYGNHHTNPPQTSTSYPCRTSQRHPLGGILGMPGIIGSSKGNIIWLFLFSRSP